MLSRKRLSRLLKNTISHFEEAANHLATLIDLDSEQLTADIVPLPAAHQRRPGAKLMPKRRDALLSRMTF